MSQEKRSFSGATRKVISSWGNPHRLYRDKVGTQRGLDDVSGSWALFPGHW